MGFEEKPGLIKESQRRGTVGFTLRAGYGRFGDKRRTEKKDTPTKGNRPSAPNEGERRGGIRDRLLASTRKTLCNGEKNRLEGR